MRKTITVDEKVWNRLTKLKYKFGCETIGQVIERLLHILTKFQMHEEFKNAGEKKDE